MSLNNSREIEKIQSDFPIFKNNPHLIYLDNASTTQKPKQVLDVIVSYYQNYNSNIHRGIYKISEKATAEFEGVRNKVKLFIGAEDRRSIVFTRGTTEGINLVSNSWGETLKPGDEILITEMEHHSNIIPWQLICNKMGAVLRYIPILENGKLNLSDIEKYINNKTRLVSIIHQSNVFGTINPVQDIIKIAHAKGALVLIDGAQSIPHMKVNMLEMDCDFYVFSGHKAFGPTGVGVLYARPELLEDMTPFMGGGEMIKEVTLTESTWNDIPWKFEAGTPSIAQVIGLGSAIEYIENVGINNINEYENKLLCYAQEQLNQITGVNIYGDGKEFVSAK